jgi:hypothetical protein
LDAKSEQNFFKAQARPNLFERKTFLLMFLFGFASVVFYAFNFVLPLALNLYAIGIEIYFYLMRGYSFLLSPVLLFIAFYRVCGRNIPESVASTVISVFVGSIVGTVVGGLIACSLLTLTMGYSFLSLLGGTLFVLQTEMVDNILVVLAALALAFVVKRWDEMLPMPSQELKLMRPFEISVASAIYIVSGILTLCVLPILFLSLFNLNSTYLVFIVAVVVLVIISGIAQMIVGRGIYNGRRWGWAVAFVASLVGLFLNAEVLLIFALSTVRWELLVVAEIASASVSFLLNLTVMGLLLMLNSRLYCRMVDPRISSIS